MPLILTIRMGGASANRGIAIIVAYTTTDSGIQHGLQYNQKLQYYAPSGLPSTGSEGGGERKSQVVGVGDVFDGTAAEAEEALLEA